MKKLSLAAGAIALATLMSAMPASADDPNDPTMRSKAARERDAAIIRKLNQDQLRYVQARDAKQRAGWEAYKAYPKQKAEYERKMAEWRHAVKMCESGHHEYCAN